MVKHIPGRFLCVPRSFRTAVPFWWQTTWNLTGMSPKRDCGSKRVKGLKIWRLQRRRPLLLLLRDWREIMSLCEFVRVRAANGWTQGFHGHRCFWAPTLKFIPRCPYIYINSNPFILNIDVQMVLTFHVGTEWSLFRSLCMPRGSKWVLSNRDPHCCIRRFF